MNEFDATTFYLGKPCPQGHEWSDMKQSLRYRSSMNCVVCHQARIRGPLSHTSQEQRFWARVDRKEGEDQCWNWMGTKNGGYGTIKVDGKYLRTHRYAWQITYGAIPDGLVVCHRCDNPICVNPSHLWLGTIADNNADRHAKGRTSQAEREFHRQRVREGVQTWLQHNPMGRARGEQNGSAKLTSDQIIEIRTLYANGGVTHRELASRYAVSKTTIGDILRGNIWRHV